MILIHLVLLLNYASLLQGISTWIFQSLMLTWFFKLMRAGIILLKSINLVLSGYNSFLCSCTFLRGWLIVFPERTQPAHSITEKKKTLHFRFLGADDAILLIVICFNRCLLCLCFFLSTDMVCVLLMNHAGSYFSGGQCKLNRWYPSSENLFYYSTKQTRSRYFHSCNWSQGPSKNN